MLSTKKLFFPSTFLKESQGRSHTSEKCLTRYLIGFVAALSASGLAFATLPGELGSIAILKILLIFIGLFTVYLKNFGFLSERISLNNLVALCPFFILVLYLSGIETLSLVIVVAWVVLSVAHLEMGKDSYLQISKNFLAVVAWSLIPLFMGNMNMGFTAFIFLRAFSAALVCDALDHRSDQLSAKPTIARFLMDKHLLEVTQTCLFLTALIPLCFLEIKAPFLCSQFYGGALLLFLYRFRYHLPKSYHSLVDFEFMVPAILLYTS